MPVLKLVEGSSALLAEEIVTEITLSEWRQGARPEGGPFALALPNDSDLGEVAGALARFSMIIVNFPTFKDGRAYSQARLLRDRYGYKGVICARGEVLYDQASFMARAGINAFEIEDERKEVFLKALSEISYVYQRASDASEPVWRLRALRAEAA